ncbi:unnamed protein product [Adineta steineri]|uniref:Ammonium transporter AmtB-like domain-containing protein n=1 Tax=Adineta steineri TaxID=433720 RepID=A0A813U2C3_9BILA|nr:unnamed protein product [Adineta steineri]CAF0930781.1 unnamed protein product [Adineta steineri]
MATTTITISTTTTASTTLVFDSGDNAWMMVSTAFVLMMTPALAFFYGGLVDRKNILNQLFLSFVCMGIVFVQWILFGFSFAFGSPVSAGFGSFADSALRFGQRLDDFYSPSYPLLTYAAYQGTFAIITPALISGAIVGRMKVIPYMIFIVIWTTCCYDPLAHWVWGSNGWLKHLGTLDFAGGTVVHISSGVSGYVASAILGKRVDYKPHASNAHNIPFTVLGTCLLWVGWTGFNAGSANIASGLASLALVNTYVAAAAGLVTWVVIDAIRGQVSVSGACIGPVVGLVGITPACGFVQPGWALLFGIIPTIIIYFLLLYKHHSIFDDTLDVAVVHGCGFASVCTAGILLPLKYTIGIRLSPDEELRGLDWIAHGEKWSHNDKPGQTVTTTTGIPGNKLKYAPYTIQNNWKPNRIASRSRSIRKPNSLGQLRSTISQSRYNASQSQAAQSDKNIQPSYTYNSSLPV